MTAVLVTGGSGFLGSSVVRGLADGRATGGQRRPAPCRRTRCRASSTCVDWT